MGYNEENGFVAQLVRALPCHGRGREFESRRIRHFCFTKTSKNVTSDLVPLGANLVGFAIFYAKKILGIFYPLRPYPI